MKIDIQKVAKLANLKLTPEEEKEFDGQLNDILSYIDQLNKIDTSEVDPTAQVTGLKNQFRKDDLKTTLSQEEALSGTDKTHNGFFKVGKLVDTNK